MFLQLQLQIIQKQEHVSEENSNDANAPFFNLQGQRVNKNVPGIIIYQKKKYVNK